MTRENRVFWTYSDDAKTCDSEQAYHGNERTEGVDTPAEKRCDDRPQGRENATDATECGGNAARGFATFGFPLLRFRGGFRFLIGR